MKAMRPLLGTFVEIEVKTACQNKADAAMAAAFAAIELVQRLMSIFEPSSDISRINAKAHIAPQKIDPWTAHILAIATDLHVRTDALFDCAIAPHLAKWGLLPEGEAAPQSSLSHLQLEDTQVSAILPVRLDLGGIAKGFAVDRAIDAIRAHGVSDACINAGGDLRVMGAFEEAIHLRDPADPQLLRFAGTLKDGAIATSATYYSRRDYEGREVSALVDPRNGEPLVTRNSYSVIAPLCCHADALTKVLAISDNPDHPCFAHYSASTVILRAS